MKLIHSLSEEDKPIYGLTTLNQELYVHYPGDTDVTVYDTETYRIKRSLQVPCLGGVNDMTSCQSHQCIYISDHVNNVVHRVDTNKTITQWPVYDKPCSLSVNSVNNVLVTFFVVAKIKEFTTDGKLTRQIKLQSNLIHPMHTVELTSEQFLICHGDGKDAVHRVCTVDSSGNVLQSYGGPRGLGIGRLHTPCRLAVSGFIFLADLNSHRLIMLSPSLNFVREVAPGLRYPMRMSYDEKTGRLYVGDNHFEGGKYVSGTVKVYAVCD